MHQKRLSRTPKRSMFLDHVALQAASFTTMLPLEEGHFALVTSRLATHNVSDQEWKAAVAELARVVAPGGRMIILELIDTLLGMRKRSAAFVDGKTWNPAWEARRCCSVSGCVKYS